LAYARLLQLPPARRAAIAIALLGALGACATQREQRISSADARERPTDETCEPKGKPPAPGSVWACGYWHWDGVRYVWVDGQWQAP
jgi:hypothetical protein